MSTRPLRRFHYVTGLLVMWALQALPHVGIPSASAHEIDCKGRSGIDLARCERHQRMFAKCGPVQGDAHFACDRDYLLANPLPCATLAGNDQKQCLAELAAAKACEPQAGRAFMRCVRDSTAADPTGNAGNAGNTDKARK